MNFNALRYFLEVAKCQSIRRASERLHIAASAVSRQISALEHELDCVLLERRSDGVSLTEAGRRLQAHGLKIEAQVQLVKSDIDELKSLHRGTIRLTTVEGVTENFLPEVLREFSATYPDVKFEIIIASRDETIDALDCYEADIGLVYDYVHHHAIEVAAHYLQPLHAFVPVDHPLARGEPVTLRALLKYDHLLPDRSFGIHQLVMRVAKKEGATVAPKAISNKLKFLTRYALLENSVIFVPVQAVYTEVRQGRLAPVNLTCSAFAHRKLSIATRRHRELSPATSQFSEFVRCRFEAWQDLDQAALYDARSQCWKQVT